MLPGADCGLRLSALRASSRILIAHALPVILLSALLLIPALRADAQQPVSVQFSAGRVTGRAERADQTILEEWARLGGATIVNGERVAGAPVTLELTNVPERQALDVILRSVAGYMLAPRRADR